MTSFTDWSIGEQLLQARLWTRNVNILRKFLEKLKQHALNLPGFIRNPLLVDVLQEVETNNEILQFIRWRSISMRAGPAFLQFDWSKAGLSMDLPVFVYSHTKTGFKFFQEREDIGSFFMCLEIFDFKPRRENLTGLLFCLD